MLTRIAIFFASGAIAAAQPHAKDYTYTVPAARKAVLAYCRKDCAELFYHPPRSCCDVFQAAMLGKVAALRRVFTERDLQSGDNESWAFTAWPLLHVVGDQRFAFFLRTLSAREQSDVFDQIFYEGSYYPEAIASGYFERKFPRVAAIYRKVRPCKASNKSLEPTADRRVTSLFMTKTPSSTRRSLSPAVAQLQLVRSCAFSSRLTPAPDDRT